VEIPQSVLDQFNHIETFLKQNNKENLKKLDSKFHKILFTNKEQENINDSVKRNVFENLKKNREEEKEKRNNQTLADVIIDINKRHSKQNNDDEDGIEMHDLSNRQKKQIPEKLQLTIAQKQLASKNNLQEVEKIIGKQINLEISQDQKLAINKIFPRLLNMKETSKITGENVLQKIKNKKEGKTDFTHILNEKQANNEIIPSTPKAKKTNKGTVTPKKKNKSLAVGAINIEKAGEDFLNNLLKEKRSTSPGSPLLKTQPTIATKAKGSQKALSFI
jgi:hypothetical protein